MNLHSHRLNPKGQAIAEAGAALVVLLPLVIVLILVIVEASYAFYIKASLSQAARQAARNLAVAYGSYPDLPKSRSLQNSLVLDQIRLNNIIINSQQFDDPVFDTTDVPHTVSVMVRYAGGQFGLPPFPNPDPLNLGDSFQISASSTYRLE